jgi:Ca-activated chloride channel family protein
MQMRFWAAVVGTLALLGCGSASTGGGGGGATPGGAQDIGLAREKIGRGVVPSPEDWPPEGLYSEHDLPLDGAPCQQRLCLRAAAAVAPALVTARQEIFVQLGLASEIDPETFRRPPLNAALVIDRSCSMKGARFEDVKMAARQLVDRLGPDDRLTLVTFDDSARHELGPVAVTDRPALKQKIADLSIGGSTCIECGLKKARDKMSGGHAPQRQSRIFLLTDASPNVGATGEGEFTELMEQLASKDVFLTTFGVGLHFGQALVTRMTRVRGANYFYLEDGEKTRSVFSQDFDLMVTPIASDLSLQVSRADGFELAGAHGFPGAHDASAEPALEVKSVFLSRRRGALVLRLLGTPAPGGTLATLQLSYVLEGQSHAESLTVAFGGDAAPAPDERWFGAPGIRKTVALTNFILAAREVSQRYADERFGEAHDLARQAAAHLSEEAEALDDPGLRQEAALADALARLLEP